MVLGATLRLRPAPTAEIEAEMTRLLTHRQATQPTAEPTPGRSSATRMATTPGG